MTIYQAIGFGVFAALSFYIPLRAYAERIVYKTKYVNSTRSPILISYAIWYIPIVFLLVGTVLFEQLAFCSSTALLAILWAYLGHRWIKNQILV